MFGIKQTTSRNNGCDMAKEACSGHLTYISAVSATALLRQSWRCRKKKRKKEKENATCKMSSWLGTGRGKYVQANVTLWGNCREGVPCTLVGFIMYEGSSPRSSHDQQRSALSTQILRLRISTPRRQSRKSGNRKGFRGAGSSCQTQFRGTGDKHVLRSPTEGLAN